MWKGTLSEIWKRCRVAVIWYEQNKAKLTDSQCIIDITWGPHRRVAQAGAPSRPRVLESKPFQVALAYRMDGDKRQFIPGSLSVQAVVSKKATYNGRVALTMMEPSCQIACDCGGEWARLPSLFADVKTVNHNLEWVAADGTCTNLGEAHNGILKSLGAKLGLWKGGVPDVELNDRWQELSLRALFLLLCISVYVYISLCVRFSLVEHVCIVQHTTIRNWGIEKTPKRYWPNTEKVSCHAYMLRNSYQ